MRACDQETQYHDPRTVLDTPEVMVKVCFKCKMKWEFTKDPKGRIDNFSFHDINLRNFLQPGSPHFEREFGKPAALRYNEEKIRESQKHNELEDQVEEAATYRTNIL